MTPCLSSLPASSSSAAGRAGTRQRWWPPSSGAEVTVVDTDGVGGSAVLTDCVPSKTLIATAELMTDVEGPPSSASSLRGDHRAATARDGPVDLARVNARVKQLAHDQSATSSAG